MAGENSTKRPIMSLLSTKFIERIVDEAKDVLEKVGVWVESEEALELLGNGGARIDRGKKKACKHHDQGCHQIRHGQTAPIAENTLLTISPAFC